MSDTEQALRHQRCHCQHCERGAQIVVCVECGNDWPCFTGLSREVNRLRSIIAAVENLADEWDRTAAEKDEQADQLSHMWQELRATKRGIAGAKKDDARRLRSVLSDTKERSDADS